MAHRGDAVLILTHTGDHFVIERVASALSARGVRPVRFDTDLFPSRVQLSTRLDGDVESAVLRANGSELRLADVVSVWARRIWPPLLSDGLEPRVREGCVRESMAALSGVLSALRGVRWINEPNAASAAENKLEQLRAAARLGLAIPRTLVTNDPEEVLALRADVGPIVAKMLTPLSVSMEGSEFFVHTSLVRDEDLERLDGLRSSPMVFQERIEKRCELRVICIGRRTFVGAIDASRSERGQVDWRRARPGEVRWSEGEIPSEVSSKLIALLAELGLVYGAVDMIVTPEGRHVFLEVNPGGEWGMLERDLGHTIGAAIAEELLRPTEERA